MSHRLALGLVAGVLALLLVPVAQGATLDVPGQANIFGAGDSAVPAQPGGGGVLPSEFSFAAGSGQTLTFSSVTGVVGCAGAPVNGADGDCFVNSFGTPFTTDLSEDSGISGILAGSNMMLVGVFTNGTEPSGSAPARLDFTSSGLGEDFTTLSPALNQQFLIGDGQGSNGQYTFNVPATATRLYLGFADGFNFQGAPGYYNDNSGSLSATFDLNGGSTPPTGDLCFGQPATITGSGTVNGTSGDDVIITGNGDDTVNGLGGNDRICTRGGDDYVRGGTGDDRINSGNGDDDTGGQAGNDLIQSTGGNDAVQGGDGDDRVQGGVGNDTLNGGPGADRVEGEDGNDLLAGNDGAPDSCDGGAGTDSVTANNGCETITNVP